MSFNALSMAKLGIGFGAKAALTFGFATLIALQPAPVEAQHYTGAGGGSSYDGGTGYLLTEHGWVKLTKFARVGAAALEAHAAQVCAVAADAGMVRGGAWPATATASTSTLTRPAQGFGSAHIASVAMGAEVDAETAARLTAIASPCRVEWIDADELLVIIGEME